MYQDFNTNMNFRKESSTINVNGSSKSLKKFIMSSIDTVNRFIYENAEYTTITETDIGTSTSATDAVKSLADISVASSYLSNDRVRFTCDSTTNKRFIVSQDCATTDPGVTIKPINQFNDVANDLLSVTLDNTS